jgi:hypothetical protein
MMCFSHPAWARVGPAVVCFLATFLSSSSLARDRENLPQWNLTVPLSGEAQVTLEANVLRIAFWGINLYFERGREALDS